MEVVHAYKSQADIDRAVKLWQKRLRLNDWDITACYARAVEMGESGIMGLCGHNVQNSAAAIYILDPIDFVDGRGFSIPYDAEATLVHEMLHVTMARLVELLPEHAEDDYEILINNLARALVGAYRQ